MSSGVSFAAIAARREGRSGDDECGIKPRERVLQERRGFAVLEAGDDERSRRQTTRRQRRAQRVDRRGVVRQQQRAVKNDWDDRFARIQRSAEPIEINSAFAGQITREPRHWLWLARFEIGTGMASEPAQQCAKIFAAAFAEKSQQRAKFFRRQRRGRRKPHVVAIFARQHRERDVAFPRQR